MFSLHTGQHTKYPANDDGFTNRPCDKYDPRKRYWYIHLTEETGITYRFFRNRELTSHNPLVDYWMKRFKDDCEGVGNNVQKQCFIEIKDCSDIDSLINDSLTDEIYIDCAIDNKNGKHVKFIEAKSGDFRVDLDGESLLEHIYDADFEMLYQELKQKIVRTKTSDTLNYCQEHHPNISAYKFESFEISTWF